jgi:hypothetical protein
VSPAAAVTTALMSTAHIITVHIISAQKHPPTVSKKLDDDRRFICPPLKSLGRCQ